MEGTRKMKIHKMSFEGEVVVAGTRRSMKYVDGTLTIQVPGDEVFKLLAEIERRETEPAPAKETGGGPSKGLDKKPAPAPKAPPKKEPAKAAEPAPVPIAPPSNVAMTAGEDHPDDDDIPFGGPEHEQEVAERGTPEAPAKIDAAGFKPPAEKPNGSVSSPNRVQAAPEPAEDEPPPAKKAAKRSVVEDAPDPEPAKAKNGTAAPAAHGPELDDELAGADSFRALFGILEARGMKSRKQIAAECERIRHVHPLLMKVKELQSRLERAYMALGIEE